MKRLLVCLANALASCFLPGHAVSVMWRLGATRVSVGTVLATVFASLACSGGVTPETLPPDSRDANTEVDKGEETGRSTSGTAPSTESTAAGATNAEAGTEQDASAPTTTSENGGDGSDDVEEVSSSGPVVVRLTQVELNHVLRDVLGDDSEAARAFVAEDEYTPFDNDAERQTVSASLVDSISVLADDVASRVVHDPTARAQWIPCEPANDTDVDCFDSIVETLGERLLRRHITAEEVQRYRRLLDFAEERQDFYVGVELLVTALIQDPEFLYRLERGIPDAPELLTDYELATRMGFLLLGSTPDDELLLAARDGQLRDPQARRLEAERLLEDPRARTQINRFHAMWLGYRAIPHDATLNAAFQLETERLIERVVFDEPQDYLQLFRSSETYVNSLLAAHYGFDAPSGGEGWVTYPDDASRAGILSHGSVLSAFSKFSDTSPTQRGIFVRARLLCLGVPSAPPTVDVDQPPGGEAAANACKAERYRAHREQSGCVDCHNLFEPIGMGLEQFDRAGRFREHDDDNEACTIEATGEVPGLGAFSGPKELATLLVDSNALQACMVRHYLQYALARTELSAADLAWVQSATTRFDESGLVLRDWIVDLVAQEQFARREVSQ